MNRTVQKTRLLAAAAIGAASLAGCAAVGPNFRPPPPPEVSGYLMEGDPQVSQDVTLTPAARAAGAWWTVFGSPALDRVMDEALAGNQTVAAANATLERMRQLAIAAHGAQLPQVDVNAGLEGERVNIQALGFSGFSNPTLGLYSIGGAVSYDADLFGGLRRSTEAALAQVGRQAQEADAAYLTLTGQTARTALQIATTRAQIAEAEQSIADDQGIIGLVRKAVAAGGEAPAASVGAEAQLASDEALLPPLRQQVAQARHALAELVGSPPAGWTAPDFELASFTAPADVPVSLPSSLVRRRPDILAAEAELHAATAEVGVATAALYPDIRLTANITQTAIPPANLLTYSASGWTLAAGLTQPLFHGGTLRANKRAAQAAAEAALAQYREVVLTAFTQVADAMEATTQDAAEIAALGRAERTAAATVHNDETAYRLGGGALLAVLDDQRKLEEARRALVMARGKRLADIAQLYVATAANWSEPKAETTPTTSP